MVLSRPLAAFSCSVFELKPFSLRAVSDFNLRMTIGGICIGSKDGESVGAISVI